jgi:hypothetical protein
LLSSFKLSYYTMLNFLSRPEGDGGRNMEFVIRNSFQHFQQERQLPQVSEAPLSRALKALSSPAS